ncbi:uncharacterized protein LOC125646082 isoform X2 [Ostrea edulis]|uniref:uncharacterized protein LOC125646082 isoform X2 n=1 Tax=Ostrea edulis TaxID=37623 RepID=UPI002095201B|nr:uncharacterized protein LOC125646082 isoform X2 [Ostrea edulis]XP_055997046.1 uncharacterized protein LOC125646082 isoform X2 [Ostrea edulis]
MRDTINTQTVPDTGIITVESEEVDEIHFGHIPQTPSHSWPKAIGIVQICSGFLTTILAIVEVFYLPLVKELDKPYPIFLGRRNCYGAGLMAGTFMVLLGSTAVRASISKRATSIKKFFSLTLFTLVLYTGITIFLIIGYVNKWTTKDASQGDNYLYEIHIFVTISTIIGFIFAVTAFVQYYELVCFGEYNLHQSIILCLLPCICSYEDD